jgi:hypothetical protein
VYEFLTSRLLGIRDRASQYRATGSLPPIATDKREGLLWDQEFIRNQRENAFKLIADRRPSWDAVAITDALTVIARLAGISFGEAFGYFARQMTSGATSEYDAFAYMFVSFGLADKIRDHDPDKVRMFDSLLENFLKVD